MSNEFKSDLRAAAELMKSKAVTTGSGAVAKQEVAAQIYTEKGVTEEMVRKVRDADSLIANAGNLAVGEMGLDHFTANPSADGRFSLSVQGFGRDVFETTVKAQGVVNIPANKAAGTEAREELRPLQISTQRWIHHNTRGGGEYQQIKGHLNESGAPLLAAIAKLQQQ